MDDLRYQVDLLSAMNQKLEKDERMLRLICETSSSAFLYYNYEENSIKTIANWDHYFDFRIENPGDIVKLYDSVEEKYAVSLRKVLSIDKEGLKSQVAEVKLKEKKLYVEVEVNVIYDSFHQPSDKIIRFKDITKINSQNDELTYMAYYDILK